jgi:hypothetical protein
MQCGSISVRTQQALRRALCLSDVSTASSESTLVVSDLQDDQLDTIELA